MCPDIIETKLLPQRGRVWTPDPKVVDKWTVLYNSQKDFVKHKLHPTFVISAEKEPDVILHKTPHHDSDKQDNTNADIISSMISYQNKIKDNPVKFDNSFNSDHKDEDLVYNYRKSNSVKDLDLNKQFQHKDHVIIPGEDFLVGMKDPKNTHVDKENKNALETSMKSFFKRNQNHFLGEDKDPKKINNDAINRLESCRTNEDQSSKEDFSSFIETESSTNDPDSTIEIQRKARRRSRFPDAQWECAETQVAKLVRYLCQEEISSSYQKYCRPIYLQITTMIESFLYLDNALEICQNLHMCPISVDI